MPEASYTTGLKTPSPEQPSYHKRQDSVQTGFHNRQHSQAPYSAYPMSTATYPHAGDHHAMAGPRALHQQAMIHNQYASDGHAHGHAPHSSVSSAASAPSYYGGYAHHQANLSNGINYASHQLPMSAYSYVPTNINTVNSAVSSAAGLGSTLISSSPASGQSQSFTGLLSQDAANQPASDTSATPQDPASTSNGEVIDPTGQNGPANVKPKVTATLWEDEQTLCFQVEAKGVSVARREDNSMINGTKLLNVAGMTRGRRDGILKSEKARVVVKIGPMHLKGVW